MTDDRKAALDAIRKAHEVVRDMCSGEGRWLMSIPANPERDYDLIITDALVKASRALEAPAVPEDENFLRHIAAVMTGVLLNCQPKPQQTETDDTEHVGGQCLAELESLRDTINALLAAAPEASDD